MFWKKKKNSLTWVTKNGLVPQESGHASHHDGITVKGLISLRAICTSNAYACLKLLNVKGVLSCHSLKKIP